MKAAAAATIYHAQILDERPQQGEIHGETKQLTTVLRASIAAACARSNVRQVPARRLKRLAASAQSIARPRRGVQEQDGN